MGIFTMARGAELLKPSAPGSDLAAILAVQHEHDANKRAAECNPRSLNCKVPVARSTSALASQPLQFQARQQPRFRSFSKGLNTSRRVFYRSIAAAAIAIKQLISSATSDAAPPFVRCIRMTPARSFAGSTQ